MTQDSAAIERLELLTNKILDNQNIINLLLSDLLEALKSRGKKELPESLPVKKSWSCAWCGSTLSRAVAVWDGLICQQCVAKENVIYPKCGQDRAAGE